MDIEKNISDILSIARLAPSVHNTQPWQVRTSGNQIIISPVSKRSLRFGDATGRETTISLGIFTEACVIAAASVGISVTDITYDKATGTIALTCQEGTDKADNEQIKALGSRYTDRSIYQKTEITPETVQRIEASLTNQSGVLIKVSADANIINRCAELTRNGLLLAFTSPPFRHELAEYLVPNRTTPYGIPIPALQVGRLKSRFEKKLVETGLTRKQEAALEYKRWKSASGIVFILGDGDNNDYWLQAGRAYLLASLAIEELGLNQATSAAVVEASDFHEDIEKLLGTQKRILAMIRIGKGKGKTEAYKSGRLPVEQILTSNR